MYLRAGSLPLDRVNGLVALCGQLDLTPGPEGFRVSPYEATRDLFQPVLADVFPGEWTYCIVVSVAPMRFLTPHIDGKEPWDKPRKHIVLQTNPDVWMFHHGAWQKLELGGIYTMDPSLTHGAVNWGQQARIHLAVDHTVHM